MSRLADHLPKGGAKAQVRGSRILLIDIETTPTLTYTFGMRPKWISPEKIVETSRTMCFAAKWYGEDEISFFSEFHDSREVTILAAWEMLNEADIVVHYNGIRFDMPRLRGEFVQEGLNAPNPWKDVDLFRMAKQQWQFESMSLNHVAERLGVGSKFKHSGFDLWKRCMANDPEAWEEMRTYNLGDVTLLEDLYDRMRGWMPSHPHLGEINAEERRCNQCGGTDLERDGLVRALVIDYVHYKCRDCGAHVRGGPHSRAASTRGAR